jgi:serine protease Do
VFRRGSYKDLSVTVAELDTKEKKAEAPTPAAKLAASALGLNVADLTAEQKRELKQTGGVLVEAVDGPAARAGLRAGDVILSVANVQIGGVREFEAVLAKLDKAKPVSVLVRRGEWAQYAVIRPSSK